ncbi:MAG: hypothetical protein SWQ30_11200 [Thermodesulfobacteriota bacterium]|nr:hypothetical protein [Thermodesulfobacteriota bacterium]
MKKRDEPGPKRGGSVSLPSSADLRGRQSVRATFKLTPRAIDTLSIVAAHLRIKQKSLFDHLIDDRDSLSCIANEIESEKFNQLSRIQKTYVLSRRTLICLGEASENFDTPRDALVEYSIRRLMPIIAEERKKHRQRKEILRDITEFLNEGEGLLRKSARLLGEDDPVYERFEAAMGICRNLQRGIRSLVERGDIIEDF